MDAVGNADATPARGEWTIDTSVRAGPERPAAARAAKALHVRLRSSPSCSDPYLVARANGGASGKGPGQLMLKVNGGGSSLSAVRFRFARGVRAQLHGSGRVGSLTLFGLFSETEIGLRNLGGGLLAAEGETQVELAPSGARISVSDLPRRVHRVKVTLSGSGAGVTAAECGPARWSADLDDRAGHTASASTAADVHCRGGGG